MFSSLRQKTLRLFHPFSLRKTLEKDMFTKHGFQWYIFMLQNFVQETSTGTATRIAVLNTPLPDSRHPGPTLNWPTTVTRANELRHILCVVFLISSCVNFAMISKNDDF